MPFQQGMAAAEFGQHLVFGHDSGFAFSGGYPEV